MKDRLRVPIVVACVALVSATVVAAIPQQAASTQAFDVASVKQNVSASGQRGAGFQTGGRFRASNMTLRGIIAAAYGTPQPIPLFRVVGGPDWLDTDRFDIDARAAADFADLPTPAGWSTLGQQMLRTLLAERFRLVVRQAMRELPAYALVTSRSDGRLGSQITVARDGDCQPPPPSGAPRAPSSLPTCGRFQFTPPERVSARGLTMDEFARYVMLNAVDRPVTNRTNLQGRFNIDLDFTRGLLSPDADGAPAIPRGTSIFTALPEQLGLKLDATRTLLDVVVIESVSRPDPD